LWVILGWKNTRGRFTFWVPVEPLSPSLSLIEHGKGTFFLAARRYSCYLFHIPTFRFTGKQLGFSLFRGRKERTLLPLSSLLSGYDRHGNCVGPQDHFFSVSAGESFISLGESNKKIVVP